MSAAVTARHRQRIDRLLVERGLAPSREKAQAWILAGLVSSGGSRIDKPGTMIPEDAPVVVAATPRFVGRGGEKLDGALAALGIDVQGIDALDVGASTGGFTDCLLQRGARRVVALDVGRGQLDWKLRQDARVEVVEGINVRYLEPDLVRGPFDLVVVDVSFIPLRLVLPALVPLLRDAGSRSTSEEVRVTTETEPTAEEVRVSAAETELTTPESALTSERTRSAQGTGGLLPAIVALVKPQFEVGRGAVGRGGIVRDAHRQMEAVLGVATFALSLGIGAGAIIESPIRGAEGNREFFIHFLPDARRSAVDVEEEARRVTLGGGEDR